MEDEHVVDMERLAAISGIGPWTMQSALLWGVAAADAHPTRDVALLRAARVHYPEISDLNDLDRVAETMETASGLGRAFTLAGSSRLRWQRRLHWHVRWVPGSTTYPLRSNRFGVLESPHDTL